MAMSDPLGGMLTRIRNGQQAGHRTVTVLYSRLHERVAEVLKEEGFIRGYNVEAGENNKKTITVELKYAEGRGVIREMARVSKPGRRVYTNVKDMPRFYNGLGILVVSTPKGVMPDYKARAANIGGEILCQVF
jgi:small subunit ribosomal protein S8